MEKNRIKEVREESLKWDGKRAEKKNSRTEELINSPYKIKSKGNLPQNIQKGSKNAIGLH